METRTAIAERCSCRSYSERAVEAWKIEELVNAGVAAPVARGLYQNMRITVIKDSAFLNEWDRVTAEYFPGSEHPLYAAPVQLLISGCFDKELPISSPYLNAGCIAENIALAATDLGLGNVLIAGAVRVLNERPELTKKLMLPEGFEPIISVAVGYAAVKEKHALMQRCEL